MDKTFQHVGIYDFWCIFGAGAVIFTSFLSIILFNYGYYTYLMEYLPMFHADWSLFLIFIYVLVSYSVGLILHSLSKLITDFKPLAFDIDNAGKSYKWQNNSKDIRRYFQKYRLRYIAENTRIHETVSQTNFDKCYDFLKHHKKTKYADKYHSLFGMSRGLFVGYALLACHMFLYIPKKIISMFDIGTFITLALLVVLFFFRAKKYYYKWLEFVFIEYQFYVEEIEKHEEKNKK